MDLYKNEKVFIIKLRDSFTPEEVITFISSYTDKLKELNCKEYCLIGDAQELKVSTESMRRIIKTCIEMYIDSGFKKIIIANLKSNIRVLNRLCKEIGSSKLKVVKTIDEAIKLCKN